MASCSIYKGTLPGRTYIGCTKLSLQERLRNMKAKPVHWLKKHEDLRHLKLTPLFVRRVSEGNALALEAAYTAEHWQAKPQEVRGVYICVCMSSTALGTPHASFVETLLCIVW